MRRIGYVKGDVWEHSKPNFDSSSRVHVFKKGQHITVIGEKGSTYITSSHNYVSKKYIKLEGNAPSSSSSSPSSSSSSGGLMSGGVDWMVAAGAGFLFMILVGDVLKK